MNNLKLIFLFTATVVALFYFSSCKDDDCTANLDCAGVCGGLAVEDCEGTCNGSVTIGNACDDGNADTVNDVYDVNCNCAGLTEDFCESLNATYEGEVLNILNLACSYDGCHPIYMVYDSLKVRIESGRFEAKVLDPNAEQPMPPAYAPEDKPRSLTDEQLEVFRCWKDAGYPEN